MTGPAVNPYAPPVAEEDQEEWQEPGSGYRLARLRQRWWGMIVDELLVVLCAIPTLVVFSALHWGLVPTSAVALLTVGPYAVWQYYMISTIGQSLGKKLLKTRVVLQDGSPPGFVRGVVLRSWLFYAAAAIPGLGNVAGMVDALLIFRADRRCLHDHLAGTRVIRT